MTTCMDFNEVELNETTYSLDMFPHTWTFRMYCQHGSVFKSIKDGLTELSKHDEITVNGHRQIVTVTVTDNAERMFTYWLQLILAKIRSVCLYVTDIHATVIADEMPFDLNAGQLAEQCIRKAGLTFKITIKNAHIRNLEYTKNLRYSPCFVYEECVIDKIILTQRNRVSHSTRASYKKTKVSQTEYLMDDGSVLTINGRPLPYTSSKLK